MGDECEISVSGCIFQISMKCNSIDLDYLSESYEYACKKLIKNKYNDIVQDSDKFDDVEYSIIMLISCNTIEGYRVNEYNLYSVSVKKLYELDYNDFNLRVKKSLVEFFEKYNVDKIELLIIKIV